jgi:hypothetical protein
VKSPSQCATWTENDLGQANCIAASKLGESSAIGRRSGEGGNASDGPEIRDWHNILDPSGNRHTMGNTMSFNTTVTQIVEMGGGFLLDASAFANMSTLTVRTL